MRIQDQDLCWSWWRYLCQFRILKLVDRTRLLRWYTGWPDDTALLPLLLLTLRSARMLDTIVCSGPLVFLSGLGRRYSHPGRSIHLPFRCHWPYRLRSNNGNCSRANDCQLSTYLRRRIPALIQHDIKASLCVHSRQTLGMGRGRARI
jgi:hypothetical protein